MIIRSRNIVALFIACLLGITMFVYSQNTSALFEQGLMKENAEGDLPGAIAVFTRIIEDKTVEPSIRAKAQLHIGMCYEKLGRNEARTAYQKVIDNYPQQQKEVASAKERMARLGEEASKPTFRKIEIANQLQLDAQLSPDGKSIAFGNNARLWIAPTSSKVGPGYPGAPKQLDTQEVPAVWFGFAWSGDGQWIVFNGMSDAEKGIYLVPAAGGKPKWISDPERDKLFVNYRMSLSPDGETIAFSRLDAGKLYIYKIPVAGGTPERLVDSPAREPVFSPDGTMIAYTEARNRLDTGGGTLWILPSEGGNPILVDDTVRASTPVWSPDGKMLAFVDTAAINKIQIIRLGPAGNPLGEKTSFDCPEAIGQVRRLAGWTSDNKIGAVVKASLNFALFTQPVDGGKAAYILTHGRQPIYPRWSPDGKRIFHLNNSGFAYVSAKGGEGTTVFHDSEVNMIQGPVEVSPDGLNIAFAGRKEGEPMNIQHIWTRLLDGGTPRQLTSGLVLDSHPCWSPDGQKIAFMRSKIPDWNAYMGDIYIVPSDGGEIRQLTSESDRVFSAGPVQWSPDGKFLAYFSRPDEDSAVGNLNILPINGGEARVVVANIQGVYNHNDIAWSPDSRRIAFNADLKGKIIKIVSLDDGSIEEIKPDLKEVQQIYDLDWSPDGTNFVFCGYTGGEPEVWFMEDFLPLVK